MTEYEKMGGTYRQEGDYILPNLEIAAGQEPHWNMGRATQTISEIAPSGKVL